MSAMTTLPLRPDGWTVEDLDLLPDDPPFRHELVDGTLIVSPPPPNVHNLAANELSHLLFAVLNGAGSSCAPARSSSDCGTGASPTCSSWPGPP